MIIHISHDPSRGSLDATYWVLLNSAQSTWTDTGICGCCRDEGGTFRQPSTAAYHTLSTPPCMTYDVILSLLIYVNDILSVRLLSPICPPLHRKMSLSEHISNPGFLPEFCLSEDLARFSIYPKCMLYRRQVGWRCCTLSKTPTCLNHAVATRPRLPVPHRLVASAIALSRPFAIYSRCARSGDRSYARFPPCLG